MIEFVYIAINSTSYIRITPQKDKFWYDIKKDSDITIWSKFKLNLFL